MNKIQSTLTFAFLSAVVFASSAMAMPTAPAASTPAVVVSRHGLNEAQIRAIRAKQKAMHEQEREKIKLQRQQ